MYGAVSNVTHATMFGDISGGTGDPGARYASSAWASAVPYIRTSHIPVAESDRS